MCTKSIKLHRLLLLDSVLHSIGPANRACSHVCQIHQTPPAAFVGFSTPQCSPANRACSHVYQIHQTPPAAFVGFSTPQYSPANRACSHVYQIHQTPPAAFVGFSTPQYSPVNRACSHVCQIHQTPPAAFDGFSTPQYSPANRACSHVCQIHQTPPAAFVGFRTVYSQATAFAHSTNSIKVQQLGDFLVYHGLGLDLMNTILVTPFTNENNEWINCVQIANYNLLFLHIYCNHNDDTYSHLP